MVIDFFLFLLGLTLILVSGELFTNAVEAIGDKLNLSKNATGSILAAVGTALPETILPIIAVLFFDEASGEDIGVGAILGAPFMLSTLAFPLVGLTVILAYLAKKRDLALKVEEVGLRRDLIFFLFAYSIALFIVPFENHLLRVFTAIFLLSLYVFYVLITLRSESEEVEGVEKLYFAPKSKNPGLGIMVFQLVFALGLMIAGAHAFVEGLQKISIQFGLSPLLFSLLVAPIATELPEKVNSVLWVLRGKDSLAVGNISGAMVFQSSIPVSFGVVFTQWKLDQLAMISGIFAIIASFLVLAFSYTNKRILTFGITSGIVFYLIYLVLAIKNIKG